MGIMYRLMYRVGFAPWDKVLPAELAEIITGHDALPPARALDMGSGVGTKSIFIATHGWRVTGVEAVPRAVAEARRRSAKAGVKIDFRRRWSASAHFDHRAWQGLCRFDHGCLS